MGAEVLCVHEIHPRLVGVSFCDDELDELEATQSGVNHDLLTLVGELFEGCAVWNRAGALFRCQLVGLFALGGDFPEASRPASKTAPAASPAAARQDLVCCEGAASVAVQCCQSCAGYLDLGRFEYSAAIAVEGAHQGERAQHASGTSGATWAAPAKSASARQHFAFTYQPVAV